MEDLIKEIRKMEKNIEDIPNITNKIINKLKIKEFPIPIVKIMRDLNFIVGQQELEDDLSGYIVIDSEIEKKFGKTQMVCVNSKDNIGHQRFTIAHELAHFLFDYDYKNKKEYYNTYKTSDEENEMEKRANKFAANLLMPKEEFIKQYNKVNLSEDGIYKLKNYFQVSQRAIDRRIIELGLN